MSEKTSAFGGKNENPGQFSNIDETIAKSQEIVAQSKALTLKNEQRKAQLEERFKNALGFSPPKFSRDRPPETSPSNLEETPRETPRETPSGTFRESPYVPQEDSQRLKNQITELRNKCDELTREKQYYKDKFKQLQAELSDLQTKYDELKQGNLQLKFSSNQRNLDQSQNQLEHFKNELKEISNSEKPIENKIKLLESKINSHIALNEELRDKLNMFLDKKSLPQEQKILELENRLACNSERFHFLQDRIESMMNQTNKNSSKKLNSPKGYPKTKKANLRSNSVKRVKRK